MQALLFNASVTVGNNQILKIKLVKVLKNRKKIMGGKFENIRIIYIDIGRKKEIIISQPIFIALL